MEDRLRVTCFDMPYGLFMLALSFSRNRYNSTVFAIMQSDTKNAVTIYSFLRLKWQRDVHGQHTGSVRALRSEKKEKTLSLSETQ